MVVSITPPGSEACGVVTTGIANEVRLVSHFCRICEERVVAAGAVTLRGRGCRPRRDPRPRLPHREAADDARHLPAVAERPAARVQPGDEPRSGRRLRRG